MKKTILILLSIMMILQTFSVCVFAEASSDQSADGVTVSREDFTTAYFSDSAMETEIALSDVSAGDKVYYKVEAAEGLVLEELCAFGADEITPEYFTVSDPEKLSLIQFSVNEGDFNRDGNFNFVDIAWMLRFAAGWKNDKEIWTINESVRAADADCDGDVTFTDIFAHLRAAAGYDSSFEALQRGFATRLIATAAEWIDTEIMSLGEITNVKEAARVSKLMEEYNALDKSERSDVENGDRLYELIDEAVSFFNKDDMNIKVMSFNVRYAELTPERVSRVVQTIENEMPDVIGIQEGMAATRDAIIEKLGDTYEILGHGKYGGDSDESSNALYNKNKFELIQSECLWLGSDPDNYSIVEDAYTVRIMTYQLLKRKSDGQIFLHVNTHLDHLSALTRLRQIEVLLRLIDERLDGKYPTILTGDFNCEEGSREIREICANGYEITNKYGESTRTYQGYGNGNAIIDFCFVDGCFAVDSYKVCDEKIDGEWVSDHNAIVSEVLLLPKYDSINLSDGEVLDKNKEYNVLFVGNSYTYYNDMPTELFAPIAESAGYDFNVKQLTKGGWALIDSAKADDSLGSIVDAELKATKYDYVILQEQSTNPMLDPGKFYDGVRNMLVKVKENGATPILYCTWGRKEGNDLLYEHDLTNEEMTWKIAAAYEAIAEELDIEVAYVGPAFYDVYTNNAKRLDLYNEDLTHPSYCGSMLAALTIFSEITGVDPTTIRYTGTLRDAVANILKEAAYKAVFETPAIPEEYKTSSEGIVYDGE